MIDDDDKRPKAPGGGDADDATLFTGLGPANTPLPADARETPDPLAPDPLAPDPLAPDPLAADPLAADPLAPDPLAPDPLADDPLAGDPLAGGPLPGDPLAPDPLAPDPLAPDPLAPDPLTGDVPAAAAPHDPILDEPAAAPAAGLPSEDPESNSATFAPGSVLSHTYRIDSFLARGGMGEVYKAQHSELGTWHAIKIILPELAGNTKIIDLFRREAGVLRNVRHDAVVAYDGVFRDESGRVYLVMEFVDGHSLSDILKERKLSASEITALRDRLASGLAAAHDTGVVHRDMSPDNIIIASGRMEDAKIIDFGIAKVADPGQATIIGDDFAGKYSYVSPEQLGMFGGQVDGRSDIYSIGLILAAAALGRPLDMGNSPLSVLEARKAVPDLSGVPLEVLDDLRAMLQPDPRDRPQSMHAVMELGGGGKDPLLDDEAAPARPAARRAAPDKPVKSGSSSKGVGLSLAIGLALLIAAGGGGYYFFIKPQPDNGGEIAGGGETPGTGESPGAGGQSVGSTNQGGTGGTTASGQTQKPIQQPVVQQPVVQQPVVQQPIVQQPVVQQPVTGTTQQGSAGTGTGATSSGTGATSSGTGASPSLQQTLTDLGVEQAPDQQAALPPATQTVNRAELEKTIDRILKEARCGAVGARFIDASGSLSVMGHLSSDVEGQVLRARLLALNGVTGVEDVSLVSLPKPQCTVIETLPTSGLEFAKDQAAAAPKLGRPSQAGTLHFRAGEFLKLQLESPAYVSYYYVDYYDGANNVVHLLPSPVAQLNKLEPKQAFHIGGTDRYTIGPPYGLDLVVAVGSSVPLFATERPEVEKADVYLADMMRALASAKARAPDLKGEYSYVFIQTRP